MIDPHTTPDGAAHAPAHATVHDATGAAAHGHAGHAAAPHADDDGPPLGPLDAQAWGAGLLGVAVGGLVAVLLYVASYH